MPEINQFQSQKQFQKLSQRQIQAIGFLGMNSRELRDEIFKAVNENPALEIVSDPLKNKIETTEYEDKVSKTNSYNSAIESSQDEVETLQHHLMSQVHMIKLSPDEVNLCERLIYNLDKYGFYGSMAAPETLLDRTRPLQNKAMLEKCIDLIHNMDPIGVCCKNAEESLLIQAQISKQASDLSLFLLDGNLEFLNPPVPETILKKLEEYKQNYHKKAFAKEILLDKVPLSLEEVSKALHFITSLNPYPANEFNYDPSHINFETPDIILTVEKIQGTLSDDDFEKGRIYCDFNNYFQIKYASGMLPEVKLVTDVAYDKSIVESAKAFLGNLEFRKSTMVLQGCVIVKEQMDFFLSGPGHLKSLTRRQVAQTLGIHESTVSRISAKHGSKYIQTEWGLFPASYFFVSGVSFSGGTDKISADVIKTKIIKILEEGNVSDSELCRILNDQGIKIARRTVTKYRQQAGIKNSYER